MLEKKISLQNFLVFLLAFFILLLLTKCVATRLPVPTEADLVPEQPGESIPTLAEFKQGRKLFIWKCSKCHLAYHPDEFTDDEWNEAIDEMSPKAGLRPYEERLIRIYVTKMNKRNGR